MEYCVLCHSFNIQRKSVIIRLPEHSMPFLLPAYVCGDCGERYMEEEMIDTMEQARE